MDGLNIADDSWANVTIGKVTVLIDLYRTYNTFLIFDQDVREQFPDDKQVAQRQVAYTSRVIEYLHSLGFEGVGDLAADRFDDALAKKVDELGKASATAPTPG